MDIDNIEFVDAVFQIPKNAVKVEFTIKTYEDGTLQTVKGTFDPADVREAINQFEQTILGEYPKYVITEKGKEWLEQMRAQSG